MKEPPSRAWWAVDGELNGHSVDQTLRYLSDCADFADEQQGRSRDRDNLPMNVISPDGIEPRAIGFCAGCSVDETGRQTVAHTSPPKDEEGKSNPVTRPAPTSARPFFGGGRAGFHLRQGGFAELCRTNVFAGSR